MVKILGFEGQEVSVSTIKLCHCNRKATVDKVLTNAYGRVPIKLLFMKVRIR
jgi:hypothetical protein